MQQEQLLYPIFRPSAEDAQRYPFFIQKMSADVWRGDRLVQPFYAPGMLVIEVAPGASDIALHQLEELDAGPLQQLRVSLLGAERGVVFRGRRLTEVERDAPVPRDGLGKYDVRIERGATPTIHAGRAVSRALLSDAATVGGIRLYMDGRVYDAFPSDGAQFMTVGPRLPLPFALQAVVRLAFSRAQRTYRLVKRRGEGAWPDYGTQARVLDAAAAPLVMRVRDARLAAPFAFDLYSSGAVWREDAHPEDEEEHERAEAPADARPYDANEALATDASGLELVLSHCAPDMRGATLTLRGSEPRLRAASAFGMLVTLLPEEDGRALSPLTVRLALLLGDDGSVRGMACPRVDGPVKIQL